MGVIVCRHCSARNTEGGDCVMCQKPLGDLPAAITAAFVTAGVLAVLWAGFTLVTHIQIMWFAVLFGGLVSGAVAHFSGGRGPTYQLVATTATVVGIVVGQLLFVVGWVGRFDVLADQDAVAAIVFADDWSLPFCVLGVVGGLWLWQGK